MINTSANASFSSKDILGNTSGIWATLEQEYKEKDYNASMHDLYMMLAFAASGTSALTHLINSCPYAKLVDEELVISLDVYVWPSAMSLDYQLSCTIGEIEEVGTPLTIEKSLVKVLDNSKVAVLPYVLDGEAVAQSPFISDAGELLDLGPPVVEGSVVSIDEDAFVVLRLDGNAECYSHTVTMKFNLLELVDEELKVTGTQNAVTLSYVDENGDTQTVVETLTIPSCVEQILEFCGKKIIWNISAGAKGRNDSFEVYYNSCSDNDEVLTIRQLDSEGKTV